MKKILMMVVFFLVFSVGFNVSATESIVNKVGYDIEKTVIDEMDTKSILKEVLENPNLIDLLLYDDVSIALEKLIDEYDCIKKLYEREDLAYAFMNYHSRESKEKDILNVFYLNTLMLYPKFIENCNKTQKDILFDLLVANNRIYLDNSQFASSSLYSSKTNSNSISEYLLIENIPYNFTATTYTYKGTPVELKTTDVILEATMSQKIQRMVLEQYPNIVVLDSPCYQYNCHAYAWYYENQTALANASTKYCMFVATPYVSDESYTPINTNSLIIGESYKVVYYTLSGIMLHSGVIESYNPNNVEVISKWGRGGLYKHNIYNVPYDTVNIVFYKHEHEMQYTPSPNGFSHNAICCCGYTFNEPHNYEMDNNYDYECINCGYIFRMSKKG